MPTSRNPDDAEKIFKRNEGINNGKYTVNAEERGFKYATYLMIRGVYTKKNPVGGEDPSNVTYYIYLGSDNYKDFNVCRNHVYNYRIRIFDADKTDTRVDYLRELRGRAGCPSQRDAGTSLLAQ